MSAEALSQDDVDILRYCLVQYRSFLTLMYFGRDEPLKAHQAADGRWYIGTKTKEGMAMARDSEEYYPIEEIANAALRSRSWTQRMNP